MAPLFLLRNQLANKNIKLTLAYDGSHYRGWQRQSRGLTIQGVIEDKIKIMVRAPVKLFASGRTDAGVHAVKQVCNFTTLSDIDPEAIKRGLNSLLPDDILVRDAQYVPLEFHSRYNARSKIYEYRILNREEPDVFLRNYLWHIRAPLDTKEMAKCLSALLGTHDFSSFRSSGGIDTSPIRSISMAKIHGPEEDGLLRIVMEADGFLRHMVRNIVGTLKEVGLGKMSLDRFKYVLESKDRQLAGIKAPPQGLFLMKVQY